MKQFLIALLTLASVNAMAQCEPDHMFYPAVLFGIGTGPHMSIQVGLQGQSTPFSLYVGGRTTYLASTKGSEAELKAEPFIEVDSRIFWKDPFGVFIYLSTGLHSGGGGVGLNVRASNQFGLRAKVGYEKGFAASGGFIFILHKPY